MLPFQVNTRRDGTTLHLSLKGEAGTPALERTQAVFASLHANALDAGAREVVIDLRELEFMNAACFRCVVLWVSSIQALDTVAQYRVRLLSNPALMWQQRSLKSLSYFAADVIVVET